MDPTEGNTVSDYTGLSYGFASCPGRKHADVSPRRRNEYEVFIESEDVPEDIPSPPIFPFERTPESKGQGQNKNSCPQSPEPQRKLKLSPYQPVLSHKEHDNYQTHSNTPSLSPPQPASGNHLGLISLRASAIHSQSQTSVPHTRKTSTNPLSMPPPLPYSASKSPIIDSDELFGDGSVKETQIQPIKQEPMTALNSSYKVLAQKCKSETCQKRCVQRTYPYCMACFETLHVQPRQCQQTDNVSRVHQDSNSLKSLSTVLQPVYSDVKDALKNEDCVLVSCTEKVLVENVQKQLTNISLEVSVQECGSVASASEECLTKAAEKQTSKDDQVAAAQSESEKKVHVSLRVETLDPCTMACDVILCLWNRHNVDTGSHPFLLEIGHVIEDMEKFKSPLLRDEVCETKGEKTKAGLILHCKYDQVADRQIANALFRCVSYTEAREKTSIVVPVTFCDDLRGKPETVTRALMHVIAYIQKTSQYTQSLRKIYLCVDSEDSRVSCRKEFHSLRIKKRTPPKCQKCGENTAAKLKPLSSECTDSCSMFCVQCLKDGRVSGLDCPGHGPCLSPIGHKNSYAVLVAGCDSNSVKTKVFIEDAERMARLLSCSDNIRIPEQNTQVITARTPRREDNFKQKVTRAFSELRNQLRSNPDKYKNSTFYFYFSGHNNETGLILDKMTTMTPKELKKELRKLEVCKILIILDCCYSGGARLAEHFNSEDFTMSLNSYSMEGLDSLMYLPRLWNLEETGWPGAEATATRIKTKVYQWASCIADEKSYRKHNEGRSSLFTDSIVNVVGGLSCLSEEVECETCQKFQKKAVKEDGIFLNAIHESVEYHVSRRARLMEQDRQQHPQLDCNHDEDFLFAFHGFS